MAERESFYVERKSAGALNGGLGKQVAGYGNVDGGWILIGVHDQDDAQGDPKIDELPARWLDDPQQHLANMLANEIDPVPQFNAGVKLWRGAQPVIVVRVWPSVETPILHRERGVIYEAAAGGTVPLTDRNRLLRLVERRERALEEARARLDTRNLVGMALLLDAPPRSNEDTDRFSITIRTTPLTVPAHFPDVVMTEYAFSHGLHCARDLIRDRDRGMDLDSPGYDSVADAYAHPQARGFGAQQHAKQPYQSRLVLFAADAGGLVGVRYDRERWPDDTVIDLDEIQGPWFAHPLREVSASLASWQAAGPALTDVYIRGARGLPVRLEEAAHGPYTHITRGEGALPNNANGDIHMSAVMTTPAEPAEIDALARQWVRELARAAGLTAWEPEAGRADEFRGRSQRRQ